MPPKAIQRLAAESKKRKYDEVGETPQDPLKATKPRDGADHLALAASY